MSKEKKDGKDFKLKLPSRISGSSDLAKTQRELEKVDDFLYQTRLRMPGRPVTLPKSSKMLDELVEVNSLSLLEEADRKKLLDELDKLSAHSPVMHISFASEPSNAFLEKIVGWSRENIDPFVLVNVGLQPSVIVGCEVRTTNKVFDLSLRNKFEQMHDVLVKKLEEIHD
jgi:hypothetical protein